MGFTDIFGGTTVAAASATFLSLSLVSNLTLGWPTEQAVSGNVVADTIEVTASAPGFNISFSDARQVSSGYTTLFNNIGANSFNVLDSLGGAILTVVSGSAWVVYLADNSTQAGVWRVFQLGAGVSTAVAAALAGAGLRAIGNLLNERIVSLPVSITPVAIDATFRAELINWTGGVGVANLVAPATIGADWFTYIRNSGSGNFTLTPAAGQVDGAATKVVAPGASLLLVSDGTNFWSVGAGSAGGGSGAFDFVNIDASGTGTLVLAGANLNRIGYKFTGILTGDRTIQVPGTIQEYWVTNSTTGAFNFYVKTAAQANPGIAVVQGDSKILASDGNNVFNAITGTVTFPIAIAQGGTNATTAPTARTNLGSGTAGDAVFVSVSQDTARAAVGSWPITPGGRLTLSSGNPVKDATTGAASVLYTPYLHDRVGIYNGTQIIYTEFTELSQTLADATKSPAAATVSSAYDMFVWNDAGTIRCTRGPAWTTLNNRGSGAGTSELQRVQGVQTNKQAITNGPGANLGTYVGSFQTDAGALVTDSTRSRSLWNMYNRVRRDARIDGSTLGAGNWNYNTNVFRLANNAGALAQCIVFLGLVEDIIDIDLNVFASTNQANTQYARAGIGINTTSASLAQVQMGSAATYTGINPVISNPIIARYSGQTFLNLGNNTISWVENGIGAPGTTTWYGQGANSEASALLARIDM